MDIESTPQMCNSCGAEAVENYTTSYGDSVCSDCVRICERCEDTLTCNDNYGWLYGDALWCMDCLETHAYYCDDCNEWNDNGSIFAEDRSGAFCSDCISGAMFCEECDAYYFDGCDYGHDDYDGGRIIHDYSYRPDAIFYSTDPSERLYFGVEIEVEAKGGDWGTRKDAAEYAHRLEDNDLQLAYLKNDGSLNCGFEIVTHPMSHDYYMNEAGEFWNTLEKLRTEYNMKSWDTRTCGLHIHISRTGFKGGAHLHRFLNLVYSNQEFYSMMAGRESDQWAKFTDVNKLVREVKLRSDDMSDGMFSYSYRGKTFANKILNGGNSDRYSAVNTQNRATVEMRIFRGTINSGKVKAHLDLAHASVEYTRDLTIQDVKDGMLNGNRFAAYIMENEARYPELAKRVAKEYLPTLVG